MVESSHDVLVVLPTERDRAALSDSPDRYRIHWLDDDEFAYPYPEPGFDMVGYTERASEYVAEHGIDAVVYSHDYANLVAGVLNDRHDLVGPGLESMFLTNHKYYSRAKQPNPVWFDYIDLETGEWGDLDPRFPAYVKPAMMTMTLLQHQVSTAEELDEALAVIAEEARDLREINTAFLDRYLDTDEYPLATRGIAVVEQPVEDWSQHCVEGWVDQTGDLHVWTISDHHYYPGDRLAVDNYATPSVLPVDEQEKMVEIARQTVRNHDVEAGFWNVEIWELDDGELLVTEINGRSATVWESLYRGTFDTSVYDALLALHTGETDRVHSLAPEWELREDHDTVGAQFHAITFGEGPAERFLDFEAARSIEETDVELFYSEGEQVEQTRTSGEWLARFQLYGSDYDDLVERADELRSRMLERPADSPRPDRAVPEH